MHTLISLQDNLRAMGIAPADTVLLHSSMKKIGPVQGGADTVLDALQDYLTPGLLVLPALNWELVNQQPRVYDVLLTPSIVGILPELFRKRPDVHRSLNPTHSVCAYGADAQDFVQGGDVDGTPLGLHSPWRKLLSATSDPDGGCDLTSCIYPRRGGMVRGSPPPDSPWRYGAARRQPPHITSAQTRAPSFSLKVQAGRSSFTAAHPALAMRPPW